MTREELEDFAFKLQSEGKLSDWTGYKQDDNGRWKIPSISNLNYVELINEILAVKESELATLRQQLEEMTAKAAEHRDGRLAALEQLTEITATLPGTYYMDPPDGGDVSITEQFRRMAEDARKATVLEQQLEATSGQALEAIALCIDLKKQLADSQKDAGWQQIETIPKDGTRVLIWVSAEHCGEDDDGKPYFIDVSQVLDGEYDSRSETVNIYISPFADRELPTHWMPLPTAPAMQKDQSNGL